MNISGQTLAQISMQKLLLFFGGLVCLLPPASASATELYNLDFTSPEVGTYQTVFGSPTVQHTVGPLTDALVFHAVTSYDQIQLNLNSSSASARYDIHYDVITHNVLNSKYAFTLLLDTPEVRSVDFNGGNNLLYVYQPGSSVGGFPQSFSDDQVYHFDLVINLATNNWTVAVNGSPFYSNTFNATSLQDLRFSMAPAVGGTGNAPSVYAALDNVVVNVVPEPSIWALLTSGAGLIGVALARRRQPV